MTTTTATKPLSEIAAPSHIRPAWRFWTPPARVMAQAAKRAATGTPSARTAPTPCTIPVTVATCGVVRTLSPGKIAARAKPRAPRARPIRATTPCQPFKVRRQAIDSVAQAAASARKATVITPPCSPIACSLIGVQDGSRPGRRTCVAANASTKSAQRPRVALGQWLVADRASSVARLIRPPFRPTGSGPPALRPSAHRSR
ncbi:hypothetical protein D3C86_1666020 [compost metagenome]